MQKDGFNQFQLSEYNNIASAHFETIKQITEFFRYYLLIVSAPAIIVAIFDKNLENVEGMLSGLVYYKNFQFLISVFVFIISFVGYLLCIYIINLRQDSVLYARTVNGIRRYFYEEKKFEKIELENHYRALPKQINKPNYFERSIFLPVVFTFSLINSAYFYVSLKLLPIGHSGILDSLRIKILIDPMYEILLFFMVLLGHFMTYVFLSWYRDNFYLKYHKIGIDIDGVLNNHRKHFCDLLPGNDGYKRLKPEDITKIPVHEIKDKKISELDEHLVFNDIHYWTNMPPIEKNFRVISKLKKQLGYQIYIFTRRPWPDWSLFDSMQDSLKDKEKSKIIEMKKNWSTNKLINISIKSITRRWLKNNGINISRNKLIVEKGNVDVTDLGFFIFRRRRLIQVNRYQFAKRKGLRFFIDDDPVVVQKMSNYCEFVFIINHPYNEDETFPKNVIRVQNWDEIYNHIKVLS